MKKKLLKMNTSDVSSERLELVEKYSHWNKENLVLELSKKETNFRLANQLIEDIDSKVGKLKWYETIWKALDIVAFILSLIIKYKGLIR